MRKSIIRALATHFETPGTEMRVVESWMANHGFEIPSCILTDPEATEIARRILHAAEIRLLDGERHRRLAAEDLTDSMSEDSDNESEMPW
jgi:hypothetical protein